MKDADSIRYKQQEQEQQEYSVPESEKNTEEGFTEGLQVLADKEWQTQADEADKARISNALNSNIALRKQPNLFDSLSEEDRNKIQRADSAHYVDRRGKPLSLSVEDIQLIKALSTYIPFYSQDTKDYIKTIGTMDSEGRIVKTDESGTTKPLQVYISIPQLCKKIIGDTRTASLKKIENRLIRLSEIEQVQTFSVKGGTYTMTRTLINIQGKMYKHYSEVRSTKGRERKYKTEVEDKVLVAASVIYSPLFLYEASNKFCPIYTEKLFEVWRRNKTELFSILLSDLESKWRQYYINSIKAERAAKKENNGLKNKNREEYNRLVEKARQEALIYKSSTLTIRDRVTTDYETDRKQRSRFIPDLKRAISSLAEYGIITERSHITQDKTNVLFEYNSDFASNETNLALLEGTVSD